MKHLSFTQITLSVVKSGTQYRQMTPHLQFWYTLSLQTTFLTILPHNGNIILPITNWISTSNARIVFGLLTYTQRFQKLQKEEVTRPRWQNLVVIAWNEAAGSFVISVSCFACSVTSCAFLLKPCLPLSNWDHKTVIMFWSNLLLIIAAFTLSLKKSPNTAPKSGTS